MAHARDLIAEPTSTRYLRAHERKSLLRFITCGSVDDGKSTLIGRLLYESQAAVRGPARRARGRLASRSARSGGELDFALLRRRPGGRARAGHHDRRRLPLLLHRRGASSSSPTRPGHEQYTRNMVTGASTADLRGDPDRRAQGRADADAPAQLPRLAARHPPRRAGGQQDGPGRLLAASVFDAIAADYRAFARADRPRRRRRASRCRRCTATTSSTPQRATCPGTTGPTLLELPRDASRSTTTVRDAAVPHAGAVGEPPEPRFPRLRRHDRRRHACGRATACASLPSGRDEHASRASSRCDGDLDEAVAGQSVTLTLADEIDVSRGDVLAARRRAARASPTSSRRRSSGWPTTPLLPRPHLPAEDRHAARSTATIAPLKYKINVNTLEHVAATTAGAERDRRRATSSSTGRSRSTPTPRTATPAASS